MCPHESGELLIDLHGTQRLSPQHNETSYRVIELSQPAFCTKCGNPIKPEAQFCPYCGNPLTPSIPTQPSMAQGPTTPTSTPPYTPPPYIGHEYWNFEMGKWIDRTKTGLLLLLIGTIITAVPFIGIVGTIIAGIGALLVILGRRAFGDQHSKFVLVSVATFIFGYIVIILAAVIFAFSIASAANTTNSPSALVQIAASAINTFLIGVIIGAAITSLSYVLITYAIQNQIGRILVLGAYGVSLAIEIAIFLIISPQVSSALNASIASGSFDPAPINAFQAQIQTQMSSIGILNLIPYALYAIAYYVVYSRVNRGEIPPRATTQPPTSPPTPPTM